MKPFCLYLHRFKPEILEAEYPHLTIKQNEKKKLSLYPNIIIKCKDVGLENSKNKFQLLLANSTLIKGQ